MEDLDRELKETFLGEAEELLESFEQILLKLEQTPDDPKQLEEVFRLAHNLKGSSRAVGFEQIARVVHELETLLQKEKTKPNPFDGDSISLLFECRDHLSKLVSALRLNSKAEVDDVALLARLKARIAGASAPSPAPAGVPSKAAPAASDQSLPGSNDEFQAMADDTERSLMALAGNRAEAASAPAAPEAVRVRLDRVDRLVDFVGEMVILQSVLKEQALVSESNVLKTAVLQLGKIAREVQQISMGLRMVPLRPTFQKLNRVARDTGTLLGKQVDFRMNGAESEIDKTILEQLSDPLVHLVRNAVDHGVETPEIRQKAGKPPQGLIEIFAFQRGDRIYIEIRDDGAGIDGEAVLKGAVEKGLVSAERKLSEDEILNLIFFSGLSTKAEVTEISGRGVGMDVVKTNIERLRGEITVTSKRGEGTRFQLVLPLTLAIVDALIVRAGTQRFVVPLSQVQESMHYDPKEAREASLGSGEVLWLRGEAVPIYKLKHLLKQKDEDGEGAGTALLVRTQRGAFGVVVDEIISQQQILIKKLGDEIGGIQGISGTAVLGDGRPALILELSELVKKMIRVSDTRTDMRASA